MAAINSNIHIAQTTILTSVLSVTFGGQYPTGQFANLKSINKTKSCPVI